MRLWLEHGAEVSLREQIVTQVILGILSGELSSGQRLPSTRELARRFHLNPNTVSTGYKQLHREGWVKFQRGSGVYVRKREFGPLGQPGVALDQLIADFFVAARKLRVPLAEIRERLRQCLQSQPPDRFVLIEPDEELRRIVAAEIRQSVGIPVEAFGLGDRKLVVAVTGAIPVALPGNANVVRRSLSPGVALVVLGVRSATSSLAQWLPAPAGALVGVASRWPRFLKLARVMLVAAGFHPNQLFFRDARKQNWQRGLRETQAVVCDCETAEKLPKTMRAVVFRVLSESSLDELRDCERYLKGSADGRPGHF